MPSAYSDRRLWLAVVSFLAVTAPAYGQATYSWSSGAPDSKWLGTGRWTGGLANKAPGVTAAGLATDGHQNDVAQVIGSSFVQGNSNGLQIDFGLAGGLLSVGAVRMQSNFGNPPLGTAPDSTANGTLRLNGGTVLGVPKVLLANTADTDNPFFVQNSATGLGPRTMTVQLGITDGVMLAQGGIYLDTAVTELNPGSGFAIRGGFVAVQRPSTFTGTVRAQGGNLSVPFNERLSPSAKVELGGNGQSGTLTLGLPGANGSTQTLGGLTTGLTSSGNMVFNEGTTLSTLRLDIAAGTNTFGGTLGGFNAATNNLALVKLGAGTLALTGANTYTGGTAVQAGTLLANGQTTGSGTGTGAVTVSGGVLGGSGRVGGPVTVEAGGTIRGGTANGIGLDDLTVVNRVTLNPGATLAADLAGISVGPGSGGSYIRDRLVIDGTGGAAGTRVLDFATAGGPVTIRLLDDAGLAFGETYTFVLAVAVNGGGYRKNGGTPVFTHGTDFVVVSDHWTFAGTPTLIAESVDLRLTVTPTPEPGAVLAGCAAAAGLVGLARRVRRRVV